MTPELVVYKYPIPITDDNGLTAVQLPAGAPVADA